MSDDVHGPLGLPGYNRTTGPGLETLDEEWVTPVIIDDPDTIRARIVLRLSIIAQYLLFVDPWGSDPLGYRLLSFTNGRLDTRSVWVLARDEIDTDGIEKLGCELRPSRIGPWMVVQGEPELPDVDEP